MFGWARSQAAAKQKTEANDPRRVDVAPELRAAWRLAFVVVGDEDLATRALAKAYHGPKLAAPTSVFLLDLLAATARISLTRAATEVPPGMVVNSALISAMWQFPAEQRAALWLAKVEALDNAGLASVLSLTSADARQVAGRAAEWLDVALDQDSGPLCPVEADLGDFVRGRLPDDEVEEFEDHLIDCPTCRTKVHAYDEFDDLANVLNAAIPEPPSWLNLATLESQELRVLRKGPPTLVEPGRHTPAVRPLAACCVALILVGLIGVRVIDTERASADPPAATKLRGAPAGTSSSGASGGTASTASSTTVPPTTATTVVVTTTSLPVLTFPTIPPYSSSKKKK